VSSFKYRYCSLILFVLLAGCGTRELPVEVDGNRAFEHVAVLADSIGPRVTGSREEAAAIGYVARAMRGYGLQVRRQPVTSVWTDEGGSMKETEFAVHSENVIGVHPGTSGRTILVSGHIDSAGRSVPGANDNASAVGVLLEVARAVSEIEWNSTIMFAIFCAEEYGLLGSRYFATHADLDSLILVINLDPVGSGRLFVSPLPGSPPLEYQKTFMRLANEYGIARAAVDPLQVILPRYLSLGFGADHMSFLGKGYPAISINNALQGWNYHSTHDRTRYIETETLADAASLVIAFLKEYDDNKEPPGVDSPRYIAQPITGSLTVFITELYLTLISGISIVAFLSVPVRHRKMLRAMKPTRLLATLLKTLFLAGVQVVFIFLPVLAGTVLQRTLYPWMANPLLYTFMGIGSGLVGLFFIVQIAKLLRMHSTGTELRILALVILFCYTVIGLSLFGTDVAYYFAAPLFLFSLSFTIQRSLWLILIGLVGTFPLLSSVGPSHVSMIITLLGVTVPVFTLMVTVFILSMPFIFYFAGSLQSSDRVAEGIRRFAGNRVTPAGAMLCFLALYAWGSTMEVYHDDHPQLIYQSAFLDLTADEGSLVLSSYDYLPDLRERETGQIIGPDAIRVQYPLLLDPGVTDLIVDAEADGDTVTFSFSMRRPAYRDYLSLEFESEEPFMVLDSRFEAVRRHRQRYRYVVLSSEGAFIETIRIRRSAPLNVRYGVHTFDATEQPTFDSLTHPVAFRYRQTIRAQMYLE
jgi:hypothetical protein